ncbi:MAG: hypothetical protein DWQ42_12935 [Planctomycetota bacterium]|nr:MAG: hypothetical protein DWQ42_12935 [Planctomycetota bacterium]REK49406.1 MAG: hypothetical protein DWQ46_00205 [Planctomycetota bacterium]
MNHRGRRGEHPRQLAFVAGKLTFHGRLAERARPAAFQHLLNLSARQDWVVYAKRPFGGPDVVLKYLARYTHRVAIANERLLAFDGQQVAFRWKDYAAAGEQKTMTLSTAEFIRRFLLHVLPSGLVRIRYYGWMANRQRGEKLALCRRLLGVAGGNAENMPAEQATGEPSSAAVDQQLTDARCPTCQTGRLIRIDSWEPLPRRPLYLHRRRHSKGRSAPIHRHAPPRPP